MKRLAGKGFKEKNPKAITFLYQSKKVILSHISFQDENIAGY